MGECWGVEGERKGVKGQGLGFRTLGSNFFIQYIECGV